MSYSESRTRLLRGLTLAALLLLAVSLLLDFFYVGPEIAQGEAQRIFYPHLGSFMGCFIAFGAAVFAGGAYLRTRNPKWDTLSLAGVEIGLGMSAITIITGMTWARPIWETWWTWDPRLTSVTIMWLTYAAYLMLRSGIEDPERRRRFAAVYSIVAFVAVMFTIIVIRIRPDTIHPVVVGPSESNPTGGFDVTSRIRNTLFFSLFTFSIITWVLIWHRIRLENRADVLARRKMNLMGEMGAAALVLVFGLSFLAPHSVHSAPRLQDTANAPTITTMTPHVGDTLAINAPLRFYFSEPMNEDSVQAAFHASPAVRGRFSWTEDGKIMTFRPSEHYKRQSDYTFSLDTTATSAAGVPLAEPFTRDFSTGMFATNPGYMAMGYVVALGFLAAMTFWLWMRYQNLNAEERRLAAVEAEENQDRVSAAVGATEDQAMPEKATPGQSGMEGPMSARSRTMPDGK